jgi:hypothetical protein
VLAVRLGSCRRCLRLSPRRQAPRLRLEELGNLSADIAQNRRDGEAYQDGERKHGGCSNQDPSPHRHLHLIGTGSRLLDLQTPSAVQPSSAIDDSEAVDSRSQAFRAAVVPFHEDL